MLNLHILVLSPNFLVLLISNLIPLCLQHKNGMISIVLNLLRGFYGLTCGQSG